VAAMVQFATTAATVSSCRGGSQRVLSSGFVLSGERFRLSEALGDSGPQWFGTKRSEVRIFSP
jgi:hypothetical protein